MSVYNAGDFRKGIKVIVEGQPFEMVHCDFVKPGKGQALYKTKLRNMLTGTLLDITYRSGASLEQADVRTSDGMYSYFDGSNYIFMDNDSFEQVVAVGRHLRRADAVHQGRHPLPADVLERPAHRASIRRST